MWEKLRRNNLLGLNFRRQHIIEGFIVDFYCHELSLAVEIDGKVYEVINQLEEDILRQRIIEKNNIKFFRVRSEDVEANVDEVLNRLKIFIKENLEYSTSFKK